MTMKDMEVSTKELFLENDKEVASPEWILDRRESGYLYWRREASVCDKRVKFRCDVQILEFWPVEEEWHDHRDEIRCRSEDIAPPSNLAGFLCICAMITILTYNWLQPVS